MNSTENAHETSQAEDDETHKQEQNLVGNRNDDSDSADNQQESPTSNRIEDKTDIAEEGQAFNQDEPQNIQENLTQEPTDDNLQVLSNDVLVHSNIDNKDPIEQSTEANFQTNPTNHIENPNSHIPATQNSPNFNAILEQTRKLLAEIKGKTKYAEERFAKAGLPAFPQFSFNSPPRTISPSVLSHEASSIRMTAYTTLDQTQSELVQRALLRIKAKQIGAVSNPSRKVYHSRSKSIPVSLLSNKPFPHLDQSVESGGRNDLTNPHEIQTKTAYGENRERIQKLIEGIRARNSQPAEKNADLQVYRIDGAIPGKIEAGRSYLSPTHHRAFSGGATDYYLRGLEAKRVSPENEVQSFDYKPEEVKYDNAAGETAEEPLKIEGRKSKDTPIYQSIDVTADEHIQREQARISPHHAESGFGNERKAFELNLGSTQGQVRVLDSNREREGGVEEYQTTPITFDAIDSHRGSGSHRMGSQTEAPRLVFGLTNRESSQQSQTEFTADFSPGRHEEGFTPTYSYKTDGLEVVGKEVVSQFNTDRGLELTPKSQLPYQHSEVNLAESSSKKRGEMERDHLNASNALGQNNGNSSEKQSKNLYNFIEDHSLKVSISDEDGKDEMAIFTELERSLNVSSAHESTPIKKQREHQEEEGFGKSKTSLSKGEKARPNEVSADSVEEQKESTRSTPVGTGFEFFADAGKKKNSKKGSKSQPPSSPEFATTTKGAAGISKDLGSGKKAGVIAADSEPGQKRKTSGDQQGSTKGGSRGNIEVTQSNPFAVVASKSTPSSKSKSSTQAKPTLKSEPGSHNTSTSANQGSMSSPQTSPHGGKMMLLNLPGPAKKSEGKSTKQSPTQELRNPIIKGTPQVIKKK